MDFTLVVSPEELKRKASEFFSIIKAFENRLERIEETAVQTRGYWLGEAGERNREGYASYRDDIAEVLKRLKQHPVKLLKIANLYSVAEEENEDIISSLPTENLP